MSAIQLPISRLKKIHAVYLERPASISSSARQLRVTRNTLKRYWKLLGSLEHSQPEKIKDTKCCLACMRRQPEPSSQSLLLKAALPGLIKDLATAPNTRALWAAYLEKQPTGYRYSQFARYYAHWRQAGELEIPRGQEPPNSLCDADRAILEHWRRSNDRAKWEKAVILLGTAEGLGLKVLAEKVERSPEKIREWLSAYRTAGLPGLEKKPYRLNPGMAEQIRAKKDNLMRLIHEAPELHGFNRASWRLADLSIAFERNYGTPLSMAMVSAYLKQEGYVFRKARKVLTSPDPEFREKLARITAILRNLGPKEKFFSVDEYGPFAVKMKGGRSLVKLGETKTFPQHQKSKGFLICTAALELSSNQVTHFYSLKKDTTEMITLIGLLLQQYRGEEKLYFSWDAAAWHASKKLKAYLATINADEYRAAHSTAEVELAPLPASAQFLNVIESVFSGLARSVIHNSDYADVASCRRAIDHYFQERNEHFRLHPKKAGKKIWGQERTVAEFRDTNNCKEPNWR